MRHRLHEAPPPPEMDAKLHLGGVIRPKGHLGKTREEMPQLEGDAQPRFLDFLKKSGISVSTRQVPARALTGTQGEIHPDKVLSMVQRAKSGVGFLSKPVLAARDLRLLDGHHRWAALYNMDSETPVTVHVVDMDIHKLITTAKNFEGSTTRRIGETAKKGVRSDFFRFLNEAQTERIRVYRLGTNPTLDNRNAGTLETVVNFMADWLPYGDARGTAIFIYDVTVELPYGRYRQYSHGRQVRSVDLAPPDGLVGKDTSYGGSLTNVAYSFPEGSPKWKATLVKKIDLKDFLAKADSLMGSTPWLGRGEGNGQDRAKMLRVAKQVLGV